MEKLGIGMPSLNQTLIGKGVGKYDKSVEILKMLAAPPMGGKIWI